MKPTSDELLPCPFCGSGALYEGYHDVDGFEQPFMFCNSCKAMFTAEGSEDWVTEESDGMDELRAHWNNRPVAHVVAEAAIEVKPRIDWSRMADELDEFAKTVRGMRDE